MDDRWAVWQAELNRLTPFAQEWREGNTEDFIRSVLNIAAKKREQRDAILALAAEIADLHLNYRQLLAFFDLEAATESWAASACGAADVERVLAAMTEWRGYLVKYGPKFPPDRTGTSTLAAMQECMREAQEAAERIRPCIDILHRAFGSAAGPAPEPEKSAAISAPAAEELTEATRAPEEEPVIAADAPAPGEETCA
ncbi:MAG: hypothetical protein ACE15B_14320 [Bryobacteraceae bacterium]